MAIIIGDLHGYYEKAKLFLDYKPNETHICLGDYLDSFNESQDRQIATLQLLINSKAKLLWGNHDLHYLEIPPWYSTGYQWQNHIPLIHLIEANKHRFSASCLADGWLCTHAGVHNRILETSKSDNLYNLSRKLNRSMNKFLLNPRRYQTVKRMLSCPPIFQIGAGRGGDHIYSGIFWFDFKREHSLADVKQIFGHTECKEPVVTNKYIALDTTNDREFCFLYDTTESQIIKLKI